MKKASSKNISLLKEISESVRKEDVGHFGLQEDGVFQGIFRSRNLAESRSSSTRKVVVLSPEEYGALKHEFIKTYRGSGQNPPIFEKIEEPKETSVRPPFMDTPDKVKFQKPMKADKNLDKPVDLERGHTPGDALGKDAYEGGDRKSVHVRFQKSQHVGEAMALLAVKVGQPTYELGQDGRSIIFRTWKETEEGKERTKEAIKILKASGIPLTVNEED
jgi:hypothetical protein